jgi:hypothetical protein
MIMNNITYFKESFRIPKIINLAKKLAAINCPLGCILILSGSSINFFDIIPLISWWLLS